jgi:hypothetical protein
MVKSGDIENVKWVLEGGSKFKPKETNKWRALGLWNQKFRMAIL